MSKSWINWVVFLAICFLAAAIGSVFTADSVKTWYPTLTKPAGTPPPWVFGPVWSILYFLMGTAAWLVYRHRSVAKVTVALTLFFVQLALNATWSFVFFGLRQPGLVLLEILLLTPYLAWVLLITAVITRYPKAPHTWGLAFDIIFQRAKNEIWSALVDDFRTAISCPENFELGFSSR